MLNGFLELGDGIGACSVHSTHRPGIAVPPGTVHPSPGKRPPVQKEALVSARLCMRGSALLSPPSAAISAALLHQPLPGSWLVAVESRAGCLFGPASRPPGAWSALAYSVSLLLSCSAFSLHAYPHGQGRRLARSPCFLACAFAAFTPASLLSGTCGAACLCGKPHHRTGDSTVPKAKAILSTRLPLSAWPFANLSASI